MGQPALGGQTGTVLYRHVRDVDTDDLPGAVVRDVQRILSIAAAVVERDGVRRMVAQPAPRPLEAVSLNGVVLEIAPQRVSGHTRLGLRRPSLLVQPLPKLVVKGD